MKSPLCDTWFDSLPLFPYKSREALAQAAFEAGTQAEREAIAQLLPVKTAKLIRARGGSLCQAKQTPPSATPKINGHA